MFVIILEMDRKQPISVTKKQVQLLTSGSKFFKQIKYTLY